MVPFFSGRWTFHESLLKRAGKSADHRQESQVLEYSRNGKLDQIKVNHKYVVVVVFKLCDVTDALACRISCNVLFQNGASAWYMRFTTLLEAN